MLKYSKRNALMSPFLKRNKRKNKRKKRRAAGAPKEKEKGKKKWRAAGAPKEKMKKNGAPQARHEEENVSPHCFYL